MNNVINYLSLVLVLLTSACVQTGNAASGKVDLYYLLEEEKLARDVYRTLGQKWNLNVFNNIQMSEQRHMEMAEQLLIAEKAVYKIYPETGRFYNAELQQTYDDLIAKGLTSEKAALEAGLAIEEMDIADLTLLIQNPENKQHLDILTALRDASERHKSAFLRNLSRY